MVIGTSKHLNHFVEISVTGIEQVSTPAGDFRAFKLEKEDKAATGQYPWVSTYLYSPQTKSVVKSSFYSAQSGAGLKIDMELIKFGSAH